LVLYAEISNVAFRGSTCADGAEIVGGRRGERRRTVSDRVAVCSKTFNSQTAVTMETASNDLSGLHSVHFNHLTKPGQRTYRGLHTCVKNDQHHHGVTVYSSCKGTWFFFF